MLRGTLILILCASLVLANSPVYNDEDKLETIEEVEELPEEELDIIHEVGEVPEEGQGTIAEEDEFSEEEQGKIEEVDGFSEEGQGRLEEVDGFSEEAQEVVPEVGGFSEVLSEEQDINDETELVVDLLQKNLVPERFKDEGFFKTWNLNTKSRLEAFQWKDCGGSAAHVVFMNVSPDPLKLPGTMKIGVNATVTTALTSPLQTNLTIEKKLVGKWVKIPCIGNFGSCMYDDLCDILYSATCPEVITKNNIPCLCPYAPRNYSLPPSDFDAESFYFPKGDYHLIGELKQSGKQLACLELYLSLA